jgi:glyoxylase-like metal-dependent hydrolase (beta-lactamase superfamily II)
VLEATSRGSISRLHLARTLLGRPLFTVEAYLVDGLLIDTGPPATAAEMVSWCRYQDISQVVNTHHHEDHAGGDSMLQHMLGVPIAAPAKALPVLSDAPPLQFYRRLVWGQPTGVGAEPLGDVVETSRYRFRVVSTPGHSPDHICLFEPRRGWLFSGDLFIHERAHYLRADESASEILASLRRALALRPCLLICSHAGFVEDACGAIERKIRYWESLADQARSLRTAGLSLREVADRLLGREGLTTAISRGHFSKVNLIRSLLESSGPTTHAPS